MKRFLLGCVVAGSLAGACAKEKPQASPASASASATPKPAPSLAAPVASGLPDPGLVSSLVNPNNAGPYAGPTGTVRGRVVAKGDAAIDMPALLAKIPPGCSAGRAAYGKLFREGPGRTLADVLVAVTGYDGYVPEHEPIVNVVAKDCFFGTRTLALTYGQRIDVASGDREAYIPELLGEHGQPQLVATPGNPVASSLYPTHVGRFVLIDDLKLFMTADVLVVKFATHAVTGLDGRFEIKGVPVGPVKVNALLPVTGAGAEKSITLEADKPSEELVFELGFDATEYAKVLDGGVPAPSGSVMPGKPAPKAASSAKHAPATHPSAKP